MRPCHRSLLPPLPLLAVLVAVLVTALVTAALSGLVTAPASAAVPAPPDRGREWVWPLDPRPAVVATFAPPADPYGPGHRGIDLLGSPGQLVLAVAPGRVTFAGQVAGRGVVVVDHGRLRSTYQPVVAALRVGAHVDAGDRLGTLTSVGSHCLPDACLHLGARAGDTYLDPLDLLPTGPVRLLPLAGAPVTGPLAPESWLGSWWPAPLLQARGWASW